jgi:hypothetical protein
MEATGLSMRFDRRGSSDTVLFLRVTYILLPVCLLACKRQKYDNLYKLYI